MKINKAIWNLSIIIILCLCLASCGSKTSDEATEDSSDKVDTSNTIVEVYDEELEDAQLNKKKSEEKDFYGTWIATSEKAEYYYGNFTITINEDKTWDAIVTDENLNGTWKLKDGELQVDGEWYSCKLCFTEQGTLIMQEFIGDEGEEDIDDSYINTVLIKKE